MQTTLYVGGDDSNHAGKIPGEFIVATFSFLEEDNLVRTFPNHRDYQKFLDWLNDFEKSKQRDYRFALRKTSYYRGSSLNLPLVIPSLIYDFVNSCEEPINRIKVSLDGCLTSKSKKELKEDLLGINGIEEVVIENFLKKFRINSKRKNGKQGFSKRPRCPTLVYMADLQAHRLYETYRSSLNLLSNEKLVSGNGLFI